MSIGHNPGRQITEKAGGRWLTGGIIWLVITLMTACSPAAVTPTPSTLHIAGSASMGPLLRDLEQAFYAQHPEIYLDIQEDNTSLGLALLADGEIDMAAASWLPEELPETWMSTPIAWDGIAVIVYPDNPLEELTMLQLRQLFAGWAFRWEDVGAPMGTPDTEATIHILSREDGSGTRAIFEERVMGEERVTLTALVMPGGDAVVDYVAEHPQAIGYVSMGQVDERVKMLRIEGIRPTPETVSDGSYHLARPFYLVTRGEPTGPGKRFIDFVLSPAGQTIVSKRYGRIR